MTRGHVILMSKTKLNFIILIIKLISKGYKPSPFFKMGRGKAETHFEKWTRLYIRGIARLQPKLIYIARCPISRMPTFLMGYIWEDGIFARDISKMLRKIWMLIGFG